MEHPILFLTKILEMVGLGDFAHHNPHVIYSWLIMAILIVLGWAAARRVSLVPSGVQNVLEPVISGLEEFMLSITGHHGKPYFPLVCTLFLYIFLCNIFGLMPGLFSPTANVNTTLSMAIVVFVVTHVIGVKEHGFKYIKHFLGPVWWLSPLIMPIEIIGHLARVLSLTFRLFGNIMAEDVVLAILMFLAGNFLAPFPMFFLFLFADFVQAFVFTMLTMMYIAGALEEAH